MLSPGVKLAPQSNALHDATNVLNLPMSRNDNIIMSHTRSKWWTRLWPESEDTGALLIDFFTVWAPGLECRSSVLGADAPLGALTAENHKRVLVPSRPWTRLDYSQPHTAYPRDQWVETPCSTEYDDNVYVILWFFVVVVVFQVHDVDNYHGDFRIFVLKYH